MNGAIVVGFVVAGWFAYYASSCLFWPYGACWWCKGKRGLPGWWGGGYRMCGWCGGSGRRLRVGRWIYNKVRQRRRGAS